MAIWGYDHNIEYPIWSSISFGISCNSALLLQICYNGHIVVQDQEPYAHKRNRHIWSFRSCSFASRIMHRSSLCTRFQLLAPGFVIMIFALFIRSLVFSYHSSHAVWDFMLRNLNCFHHVCFRALSAISVLLYGSIFFRFWVCFPSAIVVVLGYGLF